MKKYKVFETNAGCLVLVVFAQDGETIDYIHFGYEYARGELLESLRLIKEGADPARQWDGNDLHSDEMENPEILENWFPAEDEGTGWNIVADNDGIYPHKMGTAAKFEFTVKSVFVGYLAGPSRYGEYGVYYMLAEVDGVELYAEMEPVQDDNMATYDVLREQIIEQANLHGIDVNRLQF